MKRKDEKLRANYQLLTLHKEDIIYIFQRIGPNCNKLEITCDDCIYESYDDLIHNGRNYEHERHLNSLVIVSQSENITILLSFKNNYNSLSVTPSTDETARSYFLELDGYLKSFEEKRLQFFALPPLSAFLLSMIIFYLCYIFVPNFYTDLIIAFVTMNIFYGFYYFRKSKISLFYKDQDKGFFSRNKDKLGVAGIVGLITFLVGVGVGVIVAYLTKPCH